MKTDELIEAIVEDLEPVTALQRPALRAAAGSGGEAGAPLRRR
jgi:hypothetical protein